MGSTTEERERIALIENALAYRSAERRAWEHLRDLVLHAYEQGYPLRHEQLAYLVADVLVLDESRQRTEDYLRSERAKGTHLEATHPAPDTLRRVK